MAMVLFVSGSLLAESRRDRECYDMVRGYLLESAQFGSVLPDLDVKPSTPRNVTVQCENNSKGLGALDPNVKTGDRVATLLVDANVTLTIQPVVPGHGPLGGTQETVEVRGLSGYVYGAKEGIRFLDVDAFSYQKNGLRELERK